MSRCRCGGLCDRCDPSGDRDYAARKEGAEAAMRPDLSADWALSSAAESHRRAEVRREARRRLEHAWALKLQAIRDITTRSAS